MRVAGLFIYPVKSLRGFGVATAAVDALGFVGDRRFLVVDEQGRFLTQRTLPQMARIGTQLSGATLTLSAAGFSPLDVPVMSDPSAPLRTVSIWKSEGLLAEDCGSAPAAWLGDALGARCRLVRIGAKFHRPVLKAAGRPGDRFAFADAVPFLVVSEASLADLNDRLAERGEEPVPMERFRPNIVVTGCNAFAEDAWPLVRLGGCLLRSAGPSARCIMTTTDQLTGERTGPEPLRTLATYRRSASDPTNVNFGQNFIHETLTGTIRAGDPVEPLPA